MIYADAHTEFIHHPDDLVDLVDPVVVQRQINPDLIDRVKPELLFLACFVDPKPGSWPRLLWIIDQYREVITKHRWILVQSRTDLDRKGIKIVLHVEDLAAIGADLTKIAQLHDLGVRSIGLTHNHQNQFAGGSLTDTRLTDLGRRAINELHRLKMILDWAHLSEQSFFDVAAAYPKLPAFVSHSGVRAVFANPRNASNAVLNYVNSSQGWFGCAMAGSFLTEQPPATVAQYIDQVEHAVAVISQPGVGVGSDLGGIISGTPSGLANISDVATLADHLPTVLLGQNLINFLKRYFNKTADPV